MQIHNNFFYPAICHFCKDIPRKLQRCSSCKTVAYCSREHQKLDWRYHKDLCKIIAFTGSTIKKYSFKEWKSHRLNTQLQWTTILNRELYPHECQMWMFPRVCAYCYSHSNLTDCSDCLNIAYCSNEHKEKHSLVHKRYCRSLRLCMDIDLYLTKFKEYPQIKLKQNFTLNDNLPKNMYTLLDAIENSVSNNAQDIPIDSALKSEALTIASSILYTMCCTTLSNLNKCVIHLVGASGTEGTADWVLTSELLFHSIPDLCEISFYLIGPEAWNLSNNGNLCETCNCNEKKMNVSVKTDLYHEVVFNIEKPNFIFAFNSGFHEFENTKGDLWRNTIPYLFINDIPTAFTSYTEEERVKDLTYIRNIIPEIDSYIIVSDTNPFSSLRPVRDWCTKDVPVFYSNSYITIIRKTISFPVT